MRGWLSGSAAVLCLGGLLAAGGGAAGAQDEGVHVDPDSPAGKEYALPLDSARRAASGGSTSGGGTSSDGAPLFGAGISNEGGSSGGHGSGSSTGGGKSGASRSSDSDKSGASIGGVDSTRAARAVADTGGGLSAGVLTLLIAFGVLAVGILIGLSVRGLRSGHSSV